MFFANFCKYNAVYLQKFTIFPFFCKYNAVFLQKTYANSRSISSNNANTSSILLTMRVCSESGGRGMR